MDQGSNELLDEFKKAGQINKGDTRLRKDWCLE